MDFISRELEELKELEGTPVYTDKDLVRLFATFQDGLEKIDMVEKKFKRKKYVLSEENKIMFTFARTQIKKREEQYYPYLLNYFASNDEEEKEWIKEELIFFVQNKYAVMNEFLRWELNIKDEQEK
jgi:DNA gyrase/topoisomerase IV subunit B